MVIYLYLKINFIKLIFIIFFEKILIFLIWLRLIVIAEPYLFFICRIIFFYFLILNLAFFTTILIGFVLIFSRLLISLSDWNLSSRSGALEVIVERQLIANPLELNDYVLSPNFISAKIMYLNSLRGILMNSFDSSLKEREVRKKNWNIFKNYSINNLTGRTHFNFHDLDIQLSNNMNRSVFGALNTRVITKNSLFYLTFIILCFLCFYFWFIFSLGGNNISLLGGSPIYFFE